MNKYKLKFFINKVVSYEARKKLYKLPYIFFLKRFYSKLERREKVPLFEIVEIETINRCNGECSFCPVNRHVDSREYVKMDDTLFYKIIDDLHSLNYAGQFQLFSNNEPFLDKQIKEKYKYAREQLPRAKILIYTNGTLLDVEKVRDIIDFVDIMLIDHYSKNQVLRDNIKKIRIWAKKEGLLNQKIFIDNRKEDEVLSSRGGEAPNKKGVKVPNCGCFLPFKNLIIRPDGGVSLCCNDALGNYTLGNVRKQSISDIWYGKQFKEIRSLIRKGGRKALRLCDRCDAYALFFN